MIPPTEFTDSYFDSSSMRANREHFDQLIKGEIQLPRQPLDSTLFSSETDPQLRRFHDLMLAEMGGLFSHALASIPYLLEQYSRSGVALSKMVKQNVLNRSQAYTCYTLDGFDGTFARTLVELNRGRIKTLTNSPNPANESWFRRYANPSYSNFHSGPFIEVTPALIQSQAQHRAYHSGFDYIYEVVSFQFYDKNRASQIAHTKQLLKEDGILLLLEKLTQPNIEDYDLRERIKDSSFKKRYFNNEEIEWKRKFMLNTMQNGQIDFDSTLAAIRQHFKFVYLTWNSTNFYEFAASNDQNHLEQYIRELGPPFVPKEFCFESPTVRRLA